ncbi:type VII secretion target [Demequina litorisediminis]|uniref:Excreted virulence factor EspC, type VII ESX diderm n=1 Tax=Demequina litorisediminis TaxID=1849022 RepID=A0ABQ6IG93_9MICO|nr:type VII secretion target [Demequina litorisediminis]GMA36182.1 hypothetical protein GCM10025876_23860 [Demequina litorisediminis]
MTGETVAGPTEIAVVFEGLDRSAQQMAAGARAAASAQRAIDGATVSTTSLGVINAPLGAAVAAMARRADALVTGLDDVANAVAGNTATLARSWREVEDEAQVGATRLAEALTEVDGVTP